MIKHHSYFKLDEVERMQFTDKDEFTPYVRKKDDDFLVEKGTPETHYLFFRDFRMFRGWVDDLKGKKRLAKLTDEEWQRCDEELAIAPRFTNLWQEKGRTLKKGFIASLGDDLRNVTMYEIASTRLPKNPMEAAAVFYINILRGKRNILSRTRSYTGNDAIKRLAEIPVEERRWK